MQPDDKDTAIAALVSETRRAREALHALVLRMRDDRAAWHRDTAGLALRERLTHAQRYALSRQPQPPGDP